MNAWLNPALACVLLGLLGAVPLVILTPPFQVPDEGQHFLRAYQLSEFRLRGVIRDREARAMLPSSLLELIEKFLRTRAAHADRRITPQPLRQSLQALDWPLDPNRRELESLPQSAAYPPLPYLPQVIAIAAGRWVGAGPLVLLYLARLANALVAVAVLAWAVRLMPVGCELTMLFGLLPMAIFEYASLSPDAAVITSAFLFTAVALRGQFRGRWTSGEVVLAVASGLVFCATKPVYAPLLLLGLPAALVRGRVKHVVLVHAAIIAVVVGGAAVWLGYGAAMRNLPATVSVVGQADFIAEHPLDFARIIAGVAWDAHFYYRSAVGYLGWVTVPLPGFAYALPLCGFLCGTLAQPHGGPRLSVLAVTWDVLLLTGAGVLVMASQYLLWSRVGEPIVEGIQGRYFLPPLALVAAAWCSVARATLSPQSRLAIRLMLVATIIAQFVITDLTIVEAYDVF